MSIVKLGVKRQVVIPEDVSEELGIAPGDFLEVKVRGKKLVMSKARLDEELERGLAEGIKDFEEGRFYGPFDTAEELVRSLRKEGKKLRSTR